MNLPAPILDLLREDTALPPHSDQRVTTGAAAPLVSGATLPESAAVELVEWMYRHEQAHGAIADWLDFLRRTRARFARVVEQMGQWNAASSHSLGHDKWSVGWGGDALLPHANALYALKSYGVNGRVLECGAFKGSSTACLSLVCAELGYQLDCADSFEGLPSEEGHYNKGDFLGTLDEVRDNVTRFGDINCVHFIEGWYADSLKNYQEPVALLWLDVDLQESTRDVLQNVFPRLTDGAVILSDGFSKGVDFIGKKVAQTGGEPAGFYKYFTENKVPYLACPGGSKGLAQIAVLPEVEGRSFLLPDSFLELLIERL